jgi:uncharacterized YccA/Bax inhibitor family protein
MRSGNPVLTSKTFDVAPQGERMTISGTVNKTAMLLAFVLITAIYTWREFYTTQEVAKILPFVWTGAIGGFVVAMVTIFKKEWAAATAPLYALLQGFLVGGLSAIFELAYPGIVIQAVGLTFGTLGCLLMAYKSGLIKPTENFKLGVVAATGGIAILYLVSMVMSMFGKPIGFIHEGGTFGILFSVFVVVIAALNLVLDFDFIEAGAEHGAPKYMEWYGAFGLTVTLVWLYLEILRLLAKLRR